MTIPEPTDEDLLLSLPEQYGWYDQFQHLAGMEALLRFIRRAYHAERLVDQLRARVAELEAKGVAGE